MCNAIRVCPMKLAAVLITVVVLNASAGPTPARAQSEIAKLLPSDGAVHEYFGFSVGVSDDCALVGAAGDNENGWAAGAAYVFRFDGSDWVQEAKLLADDGVAEDCFGYSAAMSGDVAAIGAVDDDDHGASSGSVYVFRFDGSDWVQEAKLLARDGAEGDWFGCSVAISGDVAVIGAFRNDDSGTDSGSAYVYRYDGSSWVDETKLLPADGVDFGCFGFSVAVSGDAALIGAPEDDDNGYRSGSVYVFRYDGSHWNFEAKLLPDDGVAFDRFGCVVSGCGDAALIGVPEDDDNGTGSGSAYVFRYDGVDWFQEAKLLPSDGATYEYFGYAVGIAGDTAVVSARHDQDNGQQSGSAYVFRFNGLSWIEEVKLLASDGQPDDNFGYSAAISGDIAVFGVPYDDDNGDYSGSAYVFDVGGPACSGDVDGDGDTDLIDLAALLAAYGTSSDDPGYDPNADFDQDNDIDLADLAFLLGDYGCGA
jgi:hypothetical protein